MKNNIADSSGFLSEVAIEQPPLKAQMQPLKHKFNVEQIEEVIEDGSLS